MRRVHLVYVCLCIFCSRSSSSDHAQGVLLENQIQIREAARSFGISPRLLASVLFAEHSMNVKPGEEVLDGILARSGYNASVGIGQVKVQTAEWILEETMDTSNEFCNIRGVAVLRRIASQHVIDLLQNNETNLLIAAAYLAIISHVWDSLLRQPGNESIRPGVIATLYSLGILRVDGTIRRPHENPQMNEFGNCAQRFFESFNLAREFPDKPIW